MPRAVYNQMFLEVFAFVFELDVVVYKIYIF